MARYRSYNSSGNLYAIVVAGLAVALFFAIVLWPSGAPNTGTKGVLAETPLSQQLNDATTHRYLAALQRVKPKVLTQLNKDAEKAIASGADNDQLAALVLQAYNTEFEQDYKHLMRADVKYFEQILRLSDQGLRTVSSKAPKYCRPAHYERFEHMQPDAIASEFSGLFEYDSQGYEWVLRFNVLVLEAIESGRDNPQKYDRLNAEDQMAIQTTMMRLMNNPQVAQLMHLQGKSEAEQRRAAMSMNMCGLMSDVLATVNALPRETKARLLGELQYQARNGDLDRLMRTVQSGI